MGWSSSAVINALDTIQRKNRIAAEPLFTVFLTGRGRSDAQLDRQPQAAEYVAFYADCEHEVERVESGVRVCLAFNLIEKPAGKRSFEPSDAADPVVVDALSDRLAAHPQKPIVFPLDHHYTAPGLKPNL
jgi:hypothetical protein